MFIFAGCYERFIFGYESSPDCSQAQELVKRYTFAAHKSAVKCLAAAGPYVASGGADDLIHLYDMKAERDLGILMSPGDGAVPCLEFFTPPGRNAPSHMFSGSADGSISIWRCGSWEHLKPMRGHKGGVNAISVHASGRLALSVARDSFMRMWSLSKGVCTYTQRLQAEAEYVAFTPSGDAYSLLTAGRVSVLSTEGSPVATYSPARRVLCLAQQHDDVMLLGLEDGSMRLWDLRAAGGGQEAAVVERAHASRVRGLAVMQAGGGKVPQSVVTCSSDGSIKLWDTRMMSSSTSTPSGATQAAAGIGAGVSPSAAACTGEAATKARLTCLAAVDPDAAPKPKPAAIGTGGGGQAAGQKAAAKAAKAPSSHPQLAAAGGGQPKKQQQLQGGPPNAHAKLKPKGPAAPARQAGGPGKGKGKAGAMGGRDDDLGFEIVPAQHSDDDVGDGDASRAGAGPRSSGAAHAQAHGRPSHKPGKMPSQQQQQQQQQQLRPGGKHKASGDTDGNGGGGTAGFSGRGPSAGGQQGNKRRQQHQQQQAQPAKKQRLAAPSTVPKSAQDGSKQRQRLQGKPARKGGQGSGKPAAQQRGPFPGKKFKQGRPGGM